MLYTDTDSLIYHFFVDNVHQIMKDDIHKLKIKNVCNKIFYTEKEKEIEKLKIKKQFGDEIDGTESVDNHLSQLDYHKCLFNQVSLSTNENLIRSKNKHEVYTISQRKVALTPYDDKRILNYVYTDTLPWGYQKNI
nr:unnamed protein product [Callosobruchus chinensis]